MVYVQHHRPGTRGRLAFGAKSQFQGAGTFARPSLVPASQNPAEPMVRRPSAGGEWIRTRMGLFLSSSRFWLVGGSLFGAGRPFFVPSPAIRFAERAEGVKGPKR